MIPVLVLTHGRLAEELVKAAVSIDPDLGQVLIPFSLPWELDFDEERSRLSATLKKVGKGDGVLVLTDMFGGTATNLILPSMHSGTVKVEVVTGVNLPMLIKLSSLKRQRLELRELAQRLVGAGKENIRIASELLTP